jgi:hypothetical protein
VDCKTKVAASAENLKLPFLVGWIATFFESAIIAFEIVQYRSLMIVILPILPAVLNLKNSGNSAPTILLHVEQAGWAGLWVVPARRYEKYSSRVLFRLSVLIHFSFPTKNTGAGTRTSTP